MNPYRADAQGDADLIAMTRALAHEGLETLLLLEAVGEVEWKRSIAPALAEEDPGLRGKGTVPNPVLDTVADQVRWDLRLAVIAAEREILTATEALASARRGLLRAAEKWQGRS